MPQAFIFKLNPLTFWTAVYALAAIATVVVLLLGAWFGYGQLKQTVQAHKDAVAAGQENVRTRHAALMSDLSRRWDDAPLRASRALAIQWGEGEALRDWVRWLVEHDDGRLLDLEMVPNYFEDSAVLLDIGAIPFEMLKKSLGGAIVQTWDRWKAATDYLREQEGYDPVYANFEGLAERMRTALAEEGHGPPKPS